MQYTKEVAIAISKLSFTWAKQAFKHCLTAALTDLSLQDL